MRANEGVHGLYHTLDGLKLQQWGFRAGIMDTASAAHAWISSTVEVALRNTERDHNDQWPYNVVRHFRNQLDSFPVSLVEHTQLNLTDFAALPSDVPELRSYVYSVPQKQRSRDECELLVQKLAVDALRFWIGFDVKDTTGVSLLVSMRHCPFYRILFMMDEVWTIFRRPYSAVIHGGARYHRQSAWTEDVLRRFDSDFRLSPVCSPATPEYAALADIENLLAGNGQAVCRFSFM